MNREKTACIFLIVFMIISFASSGFSAEEMKQMQTTAGQQSAAQVSNQAIPATNDLTVRSELERGSTAYFLCEMQMMDISDPTRCVLDILREEQLKHSDTNAFKLGVYFRGWLDMDSYKQILIRSGNYLVSEEVSEYVFLFNSYRMNQNLVNLSDKEICDVIGLDYDVVKVKIDNAVSEFLN